MEVPEISLLAMSFMFVAVVFSAIISSVTGMAGGVLMYAAMSAFIPIKPLVPIHGVVQIFNNAARAWLLKEFIDWNKCLPFLFGVVVGSISATMLIVKYLDEFYPILISILLVVYTLFKPRRMPPLYISDRSFFSVGILTGVMGMIVGIVDPILGVFFMREDLSKESIIANKSLMQIFTHMMKVPAFLYLGFSFLDNFLLIAVLSLAGIVGAKVGIVLLKKLDTSIFFKLMRTALFIALIQLCYQLYSLY